MLDFNTIKEGDPIGFRNEGTLNDPALPLLLAIGTFVEYDDGWVRVENCYDLLSERHYAEFFVSEDLVDDAKSIFKQAKDILIEECSKAHEVFKEARRKENQARRRLRECVNTYIQY